ncbi:uncharacterized protein LOC118241231 isoform X1 [Electrophorus electricus]|uniref:uncharacterized protein LOC118241231 isoform X1 n=1 Tax=Electrophorus electricus TaxID=8005 RepID=UPI0015CF92EF|nr:uncharacterized protein LOC118241231 isoform X1 [Electrophorus electricus]
MSLQSVSRELWGHSMLTTGGQGNFRIQALPAFLNGKHHCKSRQKLYQTLLPLDERPGGLPSHSGTRPTPVPPPGAVLHPLSLGLQASPTPPRSQETEIARNANLITMKQKKQNEFRFAAREPEKQRGRQKAVLATGRISSRGSQLWKQETCRYT